MSHSCDPNCETREVLWNNVVAIAVTAIQPIQANDELTISYNWTYSVEDDLLQCHCNSQKCNGFLNPLGRNALTETRLKYDQLSRQVRLHLNP